MRRLLVSETQVGGIMFCSLPGVAVAIHHGRYDLGVACIAIWYGLAVIANIINGDTP